LQLLDVKGVTRYSTLMSHAPSFGLPQFDAGMRDGVRSDQDLSVDGFSFRPEHEQFTLDVRKVRNSIRTVL
jgi:hypothetical protein